MIDLGTNLRLHPSGTTHVERVDVYGNCDDPFERNFFKYFAANFNKLQPQKLITTSSDGSPIAGQMSLFPGHTEGNGHLTGPKAVGVILDHVKDENNDGATDIEDVKLFLNRNKAASERYPIVVIHAGATRHKVGGEEVEHGFVVEISYLELGERADRVGKCVSAMHDSAYEIMPDSAAAITGK